MNKMLSKLATHALKQGHKVMFHNTTRLTVSTASSSIDVWFEKSNYHVFASSLATGITAETRKVRRDDLEAIILYMLWGVE